MLAKLARVLFLVGMLVMIAAYAATVANTAPQPIAPDDYVVQWC